MRIMIIMQTKGGLKSKVKTFKWRLHISWRFKDISIVVSQFKIAGVNGSTGMTIVVAIMVAGVAGVAGALRMITGIVGALARRHVAAEQE